MADKRGFVCQNRGLFNSNTGPSHTNKKLQETYFDADRQRMSCAEDVEKNRRQSNTQMREQLAPTEYVKRHDGLAKVVHQKLAEAAELTDDKSPYYKYTPANDLENENFKLYWNRSILTDKTITFH
jgi:hypothetical protein